jgi:transposase
VEVQPTSRIVIGMDPHKRSVTIEMMRPDESVAAGGRFDTDQSGYAAMLQVARAWPERVWAVEGCNGIGRHVALRLLADGGGTRFWRTPLLSARHETRSPKPA